MELEEDEIVVRPFWQRAIRYCGDWALAIGLTVLGFWLLSAWRAPDLPEHAPAWELLDLNGDRVRLEDFRGKTVVLNFWATWCRPCLMEIPSFSEFAIENPDIAVLGIAVDGSPASLREFATKIDMTYPVLLGTSEVQQTYGVDTLPTTVTVAPDGKVADVHVGVMLKPQLEWATR